MWGEGIAEELEDLLFDGEFGGELEEVVEVWEDCGVGDEVVVGGEPGGFAVEVDDADAAGWVGGAEESGVLGVGDDGVFEGCAPGGVLPDGVEEFGGDGE